MTKDDPCISVCRFDGRNGWCVGCGRTVPEIRAWRKMSPYRRTGLLRELPRRLVQQDRTPPAPTPTSPPARGRR
ncbi:DUF1289 domain-containing protein [Methylobacterium sp. E-046]|uniref:DUF1289 domain-containing protein n=1 Tax=Methylobacterium sp. E-046 TaxID=2836576 RepID=UPI001FB904AB|nr:DUF1289 domain-containing protein [Methylobacterium sp. E-046]MCJ2101270.1 DUF1289 domain-containing protein [Methylobacterium sp. E-046]